MTAAPSSAAAILGTASALVAGDRAGQHGNATINHTNISRLWSAYLGVPISAHEVALMMVLLKVARTQSGRFNRDDYIDMAGYAALAAEIIGGGTT